MIYYASHKDHREGVLDYVGYYWDLPLGTSDPYLGIYWVFPEDSPLFPEHYLQTSFGYTTRKWRLLEDKRTPLRNSKKPSELYGLFTEFLQLSITLVLILF